MTINNKNPTDPLAFGWQPGVYSYTGFERAPAPSGDGCWQRSGFPPIGHGYFPILAIELTDLEAIEYVIVQTTKIYADLVRLRTRSAKRMDAAAAAEQVLGDVRIERVRRQHFAA